MERFPLSGISYFLGETFLNSIQAKNSFLRGVTEFGGDITIVGGLGGARKLLILPPSYFKKRGRSLPLSPYVFQTSELSFLDNGDDLVTGSEGGPGGGEGGAGVDANGYDGGNLIGVAGIVPNAGKGGVKGKALFVTACGGGGGGGSLFGNGGNGGNGSRSAENGQPGGLGAGGGGGGLPVLFTSPESGQGGEGGEAVLSVSYGI